MTLDKSKIKNLIINFLVPIICMGASLLLFIIFVYPSFRKMPELQAQLEASSTLRDQLKEKQAKLNRFIDFKAILEENSSLVDRVMPAEQNVPGLLDQISQLAQESGLDITKLSYSLSDSGATDESEPTYSAVLVSLGVDGNYDQMISFMKATESVSRLINISNFRFNAASTSDSESLSLTFILSAPFMKVESNAVTDEPISLDISSGEYVSFINKVKGFRYFEKSGDNKDDIGTKVSLDEINSDVDESSESTSSN